MIISILYLFIINLLANDIIVTAEKANRTYLTSSSTIELYEREDLERSQKTRLGDFLNAHSSLQVSTNGGAGKSQSLYLRGTENRHTLLIIDGVEIKNPTNISGAADWQFIPLNAVEKIEILKGSQSVLYGSDAIGGVIKVTTQKEANGLNIHFGSENTKGISATSTIHKNNLHLFLNTSYEKTDGISTFNEKRTVNADKDGHRQLSFYSKLNWNQNHKRKFQTMLNVRSSYTELDNFGSDSRTQFLDSDFSQLAFLYTENWNSLINSQFTYSDLSIDRYEFGAPYVGHEKNYSLQNNIQLGKTELIAGGEYKKKSAEKLGANSDYTVGLESHSLFLNSHSKFSRLSLDLGLRRDDFQYFGHQYTYKWGNAVHFKSIKSTFKFNISSGFKTPSLYETYSSSYGNKSLSPEESLSKELSWLTLKKTYSYEVSFFQIDYRDLISFNSSASRYYNEGNYQINGVELNSKIHFSKSLLFNQAGTLLYARKKETKENLAGRPRHKLNSDIQYYMDDQNWINFNINYTGKRYTSSQDKMGGFTLINSSYSYQMDQNLLLSLAIGNILNREYEEIDTYGTLGRNFLIKANYKF